MKWIILIFAFFMQGCIYYSECGASLYYYDKKSSYYDSQGNYIEECNRNEALK